MAKKNNEQCALELKGIVKHYGQNEFLVKALQGVDLSFRKNEFVSILGPSGCGKTTLLNIIGGLDRYTSGDLIIEGRSTKDYKDKDWDAYRNNCIGFVFQSYNLIPHQTILGNVEIALELSSVSKKERKNRALNILEKVGLKGLEHKKPNQLSGGQMQRVAIARALINDPEIILADEPTGALDTQTSIQIMDLLKEVAKDKLVIMVTHNPDLAEKYSSRIISLVDGLVVGDTNPYESKELKEPKQMRKPKMSFKTALALSIKNLFSKRTRTILTSIAGSIGIIGVALVLALSNGFDGYMARMQTDTLATYPVTISESSVDLSSFTEIYESETKEKFPKLDNILVEKAFKNLTGMLVSNNLSDTSEKGFLHYIEQTDKNLYYDIAYDYAFDMNDYFFTNIRIGSPDPTDPTKTIYNPNFMAIDTLVGQIESMFNEQLNAAVGLNTDFVRQYIPTIQEMPDSNELILEQYDIIDDGHLPTKPEEIVLVVDEYNGINDISLALLGFLGVTFNPAGDINNAVIFEGKDTISLEEVIGKEIYLANNDVMFSEDGGEYFANKVEPTTTGLEKLKVVGILRPKENSNGILTTGFAYHPSLTEKVLEDNKTSQIVTAIKNGTFLPAADGEHKGQFVIYANVYNPTLGATIKTPIDYLSLRGIAGNVLTPAKISIYAKDFDSKEQIKAYMDEWNDKVVYQNYATEDEQERCKITYSDMMSMMFGMLGTMVDAVTYVLVAFTSISLIVSSVMIGIITYISVVERTKEIGVLRSLGASKREISRVFNAETFLIGLFAGVLGVVVTYILSLPINLLMSSLVPSVGNIAILNPFAALALIGVSVCLTLVAGLIPSRAAAKKDPVVALRTE